MRVAQLCRAVVAAFVVSPGVRTACTWGDFDVFAHLAQALKTPIVPQVLLRVLEPLVLLSRKALVRIVIEVATRQIIIIACFLLFGRQHHIRQSVVSLDGRLPLVRRLALPTLFEEIGVQRLPQLEQSFLAMAA